MKTHLIKKRSQIVINANNTLSSMSTALQMR